MGFSKNIRSLFIVLFVLLNSAVFLFADSTYVVKKGDTLYSISRKYEITVAELRTANNLSENDVLKEGAKLVIPSADTELGYCHHSHHTSPEDWDRHPAWPSWAPDDRPPPVHKLHGARHHP